MSFTLIKGRFQPGSGIPDGDTVRMVVANRDLVFRLKQNGRPPKINAANSVPLRYEAIDAMEKNALVPYSSDATKRNLELVGQDGNPGYILSRQLDNNGRPVAFVFAGDAPEPDGSEVFLGPERVSQSINFRLAVEGHAYPMFYETLFGDLRTVFTAAVHEARQARLGVHAADATATGATWAGLAAIGSLPPIYPKLFRRLEDYATHRDFREAAASLDSFKDFLRFVMPERVFVLSAASMTGFDNLVDVAGNTVRLLKAPEDLVFRPT